ncbi:potassium-transporting ATPase subunit C [Flavihumibacter sp. UBA7668]|uniref:potassium-transporting ATPase subunit C n=1 Tax=Flavihumibacter sp. UBA7668 TaxID=1946542 RepID=UPI0025C68F3F|nr:potassium-transporting ATPase subunit C [Flavihumibacter sp. UBA7668]
MKKYIQPSIKLSLVMLILCCVIYFGLVALIGKASRGGGNGETILVNNKVVGYERIGQKFTEDRYFWSRPSAVDYNAAGSAGSNKGPSNPDYLKIVQERIDTFLVHHPGVGKEQIPADMVTASASGLDPNISPAAARLQVGRVAKFRGLEEASVNALVEQHIEKNPIGPDVVHVLKLNIALDALK